MTKSTGTGRGRPRGAKNKRTVALLEAAQLVAEHIHDTLPDAFEGDGHALLMQIYKDPTVPLPLRLEAAAKALPYEKPRLMPVEYRAQHTATAPAREVHLDQKSMDKILELIS